MGTFLRIWLGQFISVMGSGLTNFALGVWIYQRTGSATLFAMAALAATVPAIIFAPMAGALVDRWDRRWAMILADSGAGLVSLSVGLQAMTGGLEPWHICAAIAISSTLSSLHGPAYQAAIAVLVPKDQLGRANGMVQLSGAAAHILAPVAAGLLLAVVKLKGVLLIDFATFLIAIVSVYSVKFPRSTAQPEVEAKKSLLSEAALGWKYVTARSGLLGLLLFFAAINFTVGMAQVLFAPLVLAVTTPTVLGTVVSIGGFGMLVGGVLMSVWGGPKKRVRGIFGFALLAGFSLMLFGFRPYAPLLAASLFGFLFTVPIIEGSSDVIWQSKVAPEIQGRVFAVRQMVASSCAPLAYLAAGPLVDKVFGPMLQSNGALAASVGRVIGTGAGRGAGLLFVLMGLATIGVTLVAWLFPRIRRVEHELPDMIAPAPAAAGQ
jgi:MFS family permease